MCKPSFSAERSLPSEPGDPLPPHDGLPEAEQFILHHGALLGPCAASFVRTIWTQAARQAFQQSVSLLSHARRYCPQRLERACQRALLYGLDNPAAVRLILAEDLDRLPMRADAECSGQLLLSLPHPPSPSPEQRA